MFKLLLFLCILSFSLSSWAQSQIQFLTCGRYQTGNENYFSALDKIIGVNRVNFNDSVEELVAAEK
jgi:hypothetical protein